MAGEKEWESYEDVARYLLEQVGDKLGLRLERVEGKQKLVGTSGMEWTVDGKGVQTDGEAIIVIECRRKTTRKIEPEAMGAFAYRIRDVGAAGGIIVTPLGAQEGAEKIARHEGAHIVHLDKDSTTTDYVLKFLGNVFIGASAQILITDTITAEVTVTKADEAEEEKQ